MCKLLQLLTRKTDQEMALPNMQNIKNCADIKFKIQKFLTVVDLFPSSCY